MLRTLSDPRSRQGHAGVRDVKGGGLEATSAGEALVKINGIPASEIDQPGGPITLGPNGLPMELLSDLYAAQTNVDGPLTLAPGASGVWYLTAYDTFTDYQVEGVLGVATLERGIILYTAGNEPGDGGFIINGTRVLVSITGPYVASPAILSPTEGASMGVSLSIVSSAFSAHSALDTHLSSDWEIATDKDFYNIVQSSYNDTVAKSAWNVTALDNSREYFIRVRHTGTTLGKGEWSPVRRFKTTPEAVLAPVIVYPAQGAANLSPIESFALNPFVTISEEIQVPKKNDQGVIVGYVGAVRETKHVSTEWVFAKNSDFTIDVMSSLTPPDVFSLTKTDLIENTAYYLKARFNLKVTTPTESNMEGGLSYVNEEIATLWCDTSVFMTVASFAPAQPYVVTPTGGLTNVASELIFEGSSYISASQELHGSTDWQLSTSSDFSSFVVNKVADTVNKTKLAVAGLNPATPYFLRMRYRDVGGSVGPWSPVREFTTSYSFLPLITTVFVLQDGNKYTFKGSTYVSPTGKAELSFDIEVRRGETFETSVLDEVVSQSDLATVQPSGKNSYVFNDTAGAIVNDNYWARIRYTDVLGWTSPWSASVQFKTKTV